IDRGALASGDREIGRDEWLAVDAEIVVPAAVADAITEENAAGVRGRYVVEAANIPTTEGAQQQLHERGVVVVPDFVANGGTNAWFWWVLLGRVESDPEAAFQMIRESMQRTVKDLLARSERDRVTPREAATALAERNLEELSSAPPSRVG